MNGGYNGSRKDPKVVEAYKKVHKAFSVEFDFLKNHGHLVDECILKEALKRENFFINKALGQIHERNLESDIPPFIKKPKSSKTYKEILLLQSLLQPRSFGVKNRVHQERF